MAEIPCVDSKRAHEIILCCITSKNNRQFFCGPIILAADFFVFISVNLCHAFYHRVELPDCQFVTLTLREVLKG